MKWAVTVKNADSIPEIVRKAFKLACLEKPGATHIELPEDIAKHRSLKRPIPTATPPRSDPESERIQEAAALLVKAEFPMILAGNGVLRRGATEALTKLAERTGMPVVNTFMGKGAIPASHPNCLFTIGLQARDYMLQALEKADVVLSVGYDMVEYHPALWNRGRTKQIVHIDSTAAEVDDNYIPAVDIAGDVCDALRTLAAELPDAQLVARERFAEYREVMLQDFQQHADSTDLPVKPQKILWDVRQAMDANDILLSDVGAHKMWIARYFQCDSPNTCLISNGFCTMGFALPGAIGAKLACPDRNVVAICGDGGFMMNVQELETAVRLKLPMVILIWTDSQYGLIKWKQEAHFGKYSHIGFDNPDFVKLAEAFGARGARIERTEDLRGTLEEALRADGPVVIDCPVDYEENMKLSRRLGEIPSAERSRLLQKVPIFAGVNGEFLALLGDYMREEQYDPGTVICRAGEKGDEVFLVTAGGCEIRVEQNGSPRVFQAGWGDCIGEMSVLGEQPRSGTVVVGEEGMRALVLAAADFHEILINQPEIGVELLGVLSRRLAEANQTVD